MSHVKQGPFPMPSGFADVPRGKVHGPSHPLRPWYIGLSDAQTAALAECFAHGRLYRFGHWYKAERSETLVPDRTIKSLVRLALMAHGMRQLRHFHVSLTGLGRLFAESNAQ